MHVTHQADVNSHDTERLQQYMKAGQQLVDDVTWLPLYQVAGSFERKPCVQGVTDNAQGWLPSFRQAEQESRNPGGSSFHPAFEGQNSFLTSKQREAKAELDKQKAGKQRRSN